MRALTFIFNVIFILIISGCTHFEDYELNTKFSEGIPLAEKFCFPSYNGEGVYLIDTRADYKYMLYYYDISAKHWISVSDGRGLPSINKNYNHDIGFIQAFSIDDDKIIAVYNFDIYEYSKLKGEWVKVGQMPELDVYYDNNLSYNSQLVINRFNNEIYYKNKSNELYVLNKNFEWTYKTSLTGDYNYFYFTSTDTIQYFDNLFQNNSNDLFKWNIMDSSGFYNVVKFSESVNLSDLPVFFFKNGYYFQIRVEHYSYNYNQESVYTGSVPKNYKLLFDWYIGLKSDNLIYLYGIDIEKQSIKVFKPCNAFNDYLQRIATSKPGKSLDSYDLDLRRYLYLSYSHGKYYLFFEDQGYFYDDENGGDWIPLLPPNYEELNKIQD